ncbi:DNA replication factor C complex subunit Rfc1 [Taxawa tesnikishii (nom. ined.)]|nr:DNA replication factor C complex subunit Rfc1 [Dothideales sp. JES 119]
MVAAKQSSVYVVIRTDYLAKDDDEGRQQLVAVCASEEFAKDAAAQHVTNHLKHHGLAESDVNTKDESGSKGSFLKRYIVGEEDYHSFLVEISTEELIGGTITVSKAKPKPAATATSNGAKAGSKRKAPTPAEDEAGDEGDTAEEAKPAKIAKPSVPDPLEAPTGESNCLSGLTFIITGTLEGFDRKEAQALIEQYGGKMESSLKKTIDYVVLGVKAGPKKTDQIKEWGLKTINQEGLYDLIKSRPAGDAPPAKRTSQRGKKA